MCVLTVLTLEMGDATRHIGIPNIDIEKRRCLKLLPYSSVDFGNYTQRCLKKTNLFPSFNLEYDIPFALHEKDTLDNALTFGIITKTRVTSMCNPIYSSSI